MALFNFKKTDSKTTVEKAPEPKVKKLSVKPVKDVKPLKAKESSPVNSADASSYAHVLRQPRVTEKAALMAERNVYVFEIENGASKRDVVQAVKAFYNVTPKKVRVVPIPDKQVFVRGKVGKRHGGKKAYVYLREGDKIEVI